MAVRNSEKTINSAIESVLKQTFEDWELILIDDGSTDDTLAKMCGYHDKRILVYHDGNDKKSPARVNPTIASGKYAARKKGDTSYQLPARLNQAISIASGDFLARMDGDDVCYPKRLEMQLDYLRSHPDVDLVGGGLLLFRSEQNIIGKRIPPENHNDICRRPYVGFPVAHPTFFGKGNWFRWHGYRDVAAAGRCEDQELLLRAFRTSRYANVPNIVLAYREQLDLGKMLPTRRFFARMMFASFIRHGQPLLALRGALGQYLRGVVDIFAVITTLRYHILRHRAVPASSEDISQWHQVWQSVGGMVIPQKPV